MEAKIERTFGNEEVLTCSFTIDSEQDCITTHSLDLFEHIVRDMLVIIDNCSQESYLEKMLDNIRRTISGAEEHDGEKKLSRGNTRMKPSSGRCTTGSAQIVRKIY